MSVDEQNGAQLMSFIERIEQLEEEKQEKADDIKEVKAECKGQGFDMKIVGEILKLRKQDPDERAEHEALLDMYKAAVGIA